MNEIDDIILFLFEDSVGQQAKAAAVVVGRFNPPTIGHYAVFDAVKKYIRDNPGLKLDLVPIAVVVDGKKTGQDKARNPLTAEERISFMSGSGRANGVKFLVSDSAFGAFEAVRKAGFEPLAVAAGSDRAGKYVQLLNKYFKAADGSEIKHFSIELKRDEDSSDFTGLDKIDKTAALDDVLEYTDDELPTNMVSGSLARHAVHKDELKKFSIITGLQDKPKLARMMFDKIKAGLATQETPDGAA